MSTQLSTGRRLALLIATLSVVMVIATYAGFVAWKHYQGYSKAERGEVPLYTDFTSTYAASILIREMPAEYLYLPRAMSAASREAARRMYGNISDEQARGVGFAPWMYPPTFILVIAPLASMPYLLSWLSWLIVTAVPYLVAISKILPGRLAWPLALAAPPVFFNVMYGQTGFLIAGLIGLGLVLLARYPIMAGVLIGLASVKPHFGVLIPLALIAGGQWRAFASAIVTVIAMIVASMVAFGDEPWFAFIGTALFHLEGFGVGAYNFVPMTTVLATVHMAGVSLDLAWKFQHAAAVLAAALVIWTWWKGCSRPDTLGLQAAILLLATPLAVPMAYLYDLVLIVPAAAWLWADLCERGAKPAEFALLAAPLAAFLAAKEVAATFGVQIGAVLVAVLLGLALARYRAALARVEVRGD